MQDNRTYVKVYFRVNAGYQWDVGIDHEQADRFNDELISLLSPLGFTCERNPQEERRGHCPQLARGIEWLYCHPQELSGWVVQDAIPAIESALQNGTTFTLRHIDTYETGMNYTEDEFRQALEAKHADIAANIRTRFTTKRSNLYTYISVLDAIKSGIQRAEPLYSFRSPLLAIENEFIRSVFDSMVASGDIVTIQSQGRTLYRTRCASDGLATIQITELTREAVPMAFSFSHDGWKREADAFLVRRTSGKRAYIVPMRDGMRLCEIGKEMQFTGGSVLLKFGRQSVAIGTYQEA